MAHYGSWKIDQLLTFTCDTNSVSTANEADADSLPTYRIYEDETGTPILTGTMALLDDANTIGFYSEQIALSAANGFERGKSYHVRVHAIVGTIASNLTHNFQIGAGVDISYWLGVAPNALQSGRVDSYVGALAAGVLAAAAFAADFVTLVAQAVWNAVATTYNTALTMGNKLNSAASAGDPWNTALPGAYGAGTAGKIVGDNLNATVSSVFSRLGAPAGASMSADIAAVRVDTQAITTTAQAEPVAVPAANAAPLAKLSWLFTLSRNKITQTSGTQLVRNDADSATIGTSTVSDDTVTAVRGEFS